MKYIFLLGRVLFALIFIVKPIEHFCPRIIGHAAEKGVPAPEILVPIWGILAFLGGLSILLGYKAKIGAWLLVVFLLPVTICIHTFWNAQTSFAGMMDGFCFWKNIALMGAALMVAYSGSGPLSLKD